MYTKTFTISGMHCDACVKLVTKALKTVPHVTEVEVSLERAEASVAASKMPSLLELNHAVAQFSDEYKVHEKGTFIAPAHTHPSFWSTYRPVIIIYMLITLLTWVKALLTNDSHVMNVMSDFMAFFFIIFAGFKIANLKNFPAAFARYDLLAAKSRIYAVSYPFIELLLGLLFLFKVQMFFASVATIFVMGIGAVGVINALRKKSVIECACLGGFFKLPMSKVALFEDVSMVVMAIGMIWLYQ